MFDTILFDSQLRKFRMWCPVSLHGDKLIESKASTKLFIAVNVSTRIIIVAYFFIGFIFVTWIILPGIKRVLFWRGIIFCFPVTLSVCFSRLASATTSYISSWYNSSHKYYGIHSLLIMHLVIISIKIFNETVVFINDHFGSREHSLFLFQVASAAAEQIEKAIQEDTILQCKKNLQL